MKTYRSFHRLLNANSILASSLLLSSALSAQTVVEPDYGVAELKYLQAEDGSDGVDVDKAIVQVEYMVPAGAEVLIPIGEFRVDTVHRIQVSSAGVGGDSSGELLLMYKPGKIEEGVVSEVKFSASHLHYNVMAADNDDGWLGLLALHAFNPMPVDVKISVSIISPMENSWYYTTPTQTEIARFEPIQPQLLVAKGDVIPGFSKEPGVYVDGAKVLTEDSVATVLSGSYISQSPNNQAGGNSLLFEADNSRIPMEGAGSRFMWHSGKSALRVGTANANSWTDQHIGYNSVAFGSGSMAHGDQAVAFGNHSFVMGDNAFATGNNAVATGYAAASIGMSSVSRGTGALAIGHITDADGKYSFAGGHDSTASGQTSFAFGEKILNASDRGFVVGQYNVDSRDIQFAVGNGADEANRSNAFVVKKDGSADLAGPLTVGGEIVLTDGASMRYALGLSRNIVLAGGISDGLRSVAMSGGETDSDYATAMSLAQADGHGSVAMADGTTDAAYAVAMAGGLAKASYSTAMGFNEPRVTDAGRAAWQGDDQNSVLEVGIGSSDSDRKNALTVLQDGSVEIGKATADDNSVPLHIKADGSVVLSKAQGDISMGIFGAAE
ncbi:hypothetical protein [Rubritalea marina]|uniref:hypothetical protein n=1 Tax=Rubritalea marina TaxID=361055 RepID=UPI00037765B4|nr:hypothetical protein [Rubritalea marina]